MDGTLLELKTQLGARNARTGVRSCGLSLVDLYQLLGYAMFDRSDRYGIHSIGIYSARYGHLMCWPLLDALSEMAGEPVVLARERETVWALLGGSSKTRHKLPLR